MKKIFVTGINGLLGTNLIELLLNNGFCVTGLIRNKAKFEGSTHPNLKLLQGSLSDDFTALLHEIDVVIHIAAETNQNLPRYSAYEKNNYHQTVQLLQSCIFCKVKKFIFVSTANTLGYGSLSDLGHESKEIKSPFISSYYAKSKLEAERYLLKQTDKIDIVIVNPTFMLGAFDTKPSSGKIILMGWKKKIVFYPPGGKNFVHVKDVAYGIIKCIHKGRNGERYLLANCNLTYFEFFKKLNAIAGQNPIMIRIPKIILIALGYLGDCLRFLKIKTNISSTNMKALCIDNFYGNRKSIHELEINYKPVDTAISDALEYFKHKNEKLKVE